MQNLWVLTEERPKNSVVKTILEEYCREYNAAISVNDSLKIKPIFANGVFTFDYAVENISITDIGKITIKIVSGNSSFVDYLLVRSENVPDDHSVSGILMAIEETKTGDDGSRNTAVYQRASKFVYIDNYCPNAKKYMLYNEEMTPDAERMPTATNVFGTGMMLTLGVRFIGKTMGSAFKAFTSIDELIAKKGEMHLPNSTNVPILIKKISDNEITVSGRLVKNDTLSHDPNIGGLSLIGATLRKLGWQGKITITRHGLKQEYITKTRGRNKGLYLFAKLGMSLDGITMPANVSMPEAYWNYSETSEKVASILLHLTAQYAGIHGIYENHAGCERGYYRRGNGSLFALPKKDAAGVNLYLPDLVLRNDTDKEIYLIEGKKIETLSKGLEEIEDYGSIENEYITPDYPAYKISRWLSIFGGEKAALPHPHVLLYVAAGGKVILNPNAPAAIKSAFRAVGLAV
ncbi:MAG: hypothetical protein LBQ40_07095 [Clostridiales bacterium]|jgi:hypothetical protein|nr:hypothetical protein [Clostridiales bacterium]